MIFIETYKMTKQTTQIKLVVAVILAFLCTIFFAGYKINAAKIKVDQWLIGKKNAVISCSPSGSFNRSQLINQDNSDKEFNDHRSINNKDPANKNNGNSCIHQQGANSLCETTNSKRRVFRIHTC